VLLAAALLPALADTFGTLRCATQPRLFRFIFFERLGSNCSEKMYELRRHAWTLGLPLRSPACHLVAFFSTLQGASHEATEIARRSPVGSSCAQLPAFVEHGTPTPMTSSFRFRLLPPTKSEYTTNRKTSATLSADAKIPPRPL